MSFEYYSRIGASLFPIPAGDKIPAKNSRPYLDCSADPEQWAKWQTLYPGWNWILVAGPSDLIVVDIDAKRIGQEAAWNLWSDWCKRHGLQIYTPQVITPSGGWHVYFSVPAGLDLGQPALCSGIDIRAGNGYVLVPPSIIGGVPYSFVLADTSSPYPAPQCLIDHCLAPPRGAAKPDANFSQGYDKSEMAAFIKAGADANLWDERDDWRNLGMALKVEYGDDGYALWELSHNSERAHRDGPGQWKSFSGTYRGEGDVTLDTTFALAHRSKISCNIRRSVESLTTGVEAPVGRPQTANALPVAAGFAELERLATPRLRDFLNATMDAPARPTQGEAPKLPVDMTSHPLYNLLNDCISRVFALAESGTRCRPERLTEPLIILLAMASPSQSDKAKETYEAVTRRLTSMGVRIQERKIRGQAAALCEAVERCTVQAESWIYDKDKDKPEPNNPDNVTVLLSHVDCEVRWNAWNERAEIRGGNEPPLLYWPVWTPVEDWIINILAMRAARTRTRFCPSIDFLDRTLEAIARLNTVDPVLDLIKDMDSKWDGTSRLDKWLSVYCGCPDDIYHQTVGRVMLGGIVRRARHPGCKFDNMAILFGRQGTGKSTLVAILGLRDVWFSDSIELGEDAKELITLLAGKLVVEISEMRARGAAGIDHKKAMISRQTDHGRVAYARHSSERPRRNVFIGTTNDDKPLEDPSGNRRFLPVHIEQQIDLEGLRRDIGLLIGEAARLESAGEQFLIPRDVWSVVEGKQEESRAESDIETLFGDWFGTTPFGESSFVTETDLVTLYRALGYRNAGRIVKPLMRRIGFERDRTSIGGKIVWVWVKNPKKALPKHFPKFPRYHLDLSKNGEPRVLLRDFGPPEIPK